MRGTSRWQYAIIDVGIINSRARMTEVLGAAGRARWELVGVYDKASNWIGVVEKDSMLLERPVGDGVDPPAWSHEVRA